jgi:hypothetical protein
MGASKRPVKILVALVVFAGLGFLFVRSATQSRAEPYKVAREQLSGWSVGLVSESNPGKALLVLRPPQGLVGGLFQQIFARAMESLSSPAAEGMPLVMRAEAQRAFGDEMSPEVLLATARSAGLEGATLQPRCLGYRRVSDPAGTRQLYFLLFDAPAFSRFRQQLAGMARGGGRFDPDEVSPVLLIAGADTSFEAWLPLRADPGKDCVAPIVTK